jgi:hypothetical protein
MAVKMTAMIPSPTSDTTPPRTANRVDEKRDAADRSLVLHLLIAHYATASLVLIAMGLMLAGNWVLFGFRYTTKATLITPAAVVCSD